MIRLTRMNDTPIVVNCELIVTVEHTPDTVVTLSGGEKLLVRESSEEVMARALEYRKSVMAGCWAGPVRLSGNA